MSAKFPTVYTPFYDAEFDVESPVSEEVVRKMAQNINLLGKLACIGQIRMAQPNIPGAPVPSPIQFLFCDGTTEITDGTSPLSTVTTPNFPPDFRNKYIRGAANSSTNSVVGANTANFAHNHGAATGQYDHTRFTHSVYMFWASFYKHRHVGMTSDLSATQTLMDLGYMYLAIYLKIN